MLLRQGQLGVLPSVWVLGILTYTGKKPGKSGGLKVANCIYAAPGMTKVNV
jgi:hypothetical protein